MIRVEAHAGATYPEYPTAIWRGETRFAVRQVLRSWRSPEALYFKVVLDSGETLEMSYQSRADVWTCVRPSEEHS